MINIAVCDDDVQFAAALEEKILDYGKKEGVRIDTEVFSEGESFLQAVFNDSFYILYTWMLNGKKRWDIYSSGGKEEAFGSTCNLHNLS